MIDEIDNQTTSYNQLRDRVNPSLGRILSTMCIIPFVYASISLVIFPNWTVDDAFITFRYASNLANYGQLTWNVGMEPVEGYTGLMLPILLAAMMKLGIVPEIGSKIIGVASFLLSGYILWSTLAGMGVGQLIRLISLTLFFTAPFAFTHALSGLETTLFTLTVLLVPFALVSAVHPWLLMTSLILVSLVRPEGAALAGITIIILFLQQRKLAHSVALFVVPYAVYLLWRWHYYGDILPNTFYAKSFDGFINPDSLASLVEFVRGYLLVPTAAGICLTIIGMTRAKRCLNFRFPTPVVVLIAFSILIVLVYLHSKLAMNYSYRFFVPIYPLGLLSFGWLSQESVRMIGAKPPVSFLRSSCALGLLLGISSIQVVNQVSAFEAEKAGVAGYKRLVEDEHMKVAQSLRRKVPPEEWLIAYIDAGIIPYYTELKTVDFGGLSDKVLAKGQLSEAEKIDYFYSYNAAAVVVTSFKPERVERDNLTTRLMQDGRFEKYVLAVKYGTEANRNYYEFVFLRKDLID